MRGMRAILTEGHDEDGEVCHRHVDVFLRQLFPDGLQMDFQLISYLGLRLQFMVLIQHGPRHDSPVGSDLESLEANDSCQ